ncbi:glycoside hydrolase family 36 protein [Microlunatus sp. GCM10028923]|uniref:glycoside hydrolase family 36 protein n=1 Tax=Microlunatus sp. GCM10028923 TaxID=3273400 RepID=UPI00361D3F2F
MTTTQLWQPHDRPAGGTDEDGAEQHRRIPVDLDGPGPALDLEVTSRSEVEAVITPVGPGVAELRLTPRRTTVIRAAWQLPATDVVTTWTPSGGHRGLPAFWHRPRTSSLEKGAPVASLIGTGDRALCTFAVAEGVRPVRIRTGVVEETGEFACWVEQTAAPDRPLLLRLDLSGRPFADTLAGVAAWWAEHYPAEPAPLAARTPVYSTWYAMHQYVSAADVERQAGPAAELGCTMIIVDDGWHSTDRNRGYGYVGEWDPSPAAFPDLTGHVATVHETGLTYLLWYAIPFVGRKTELWSRVEPYTLVVREDLDAGVLDPRYPAIRTLIVDRLSRAVTEWGMDGLKIDFVDQFAVEDPPAAGPEADCADVTEGVDRLLGELHDRFEAAGKQPLIELRQPYVSPGLWRHATMIRAGDCPLSAVQNRQSTVDLRLIAGPLAVHADMLMWHPDEKPEQVAAQLINVLFSVPQISVDLTRQTPDQLATLRFWLDFGVANAEVLQHGRLTPVRPDLGYPLVIADGDQLRIVGRYAPFPITAPADRTLLVANADASTAVALTAAAPVAATATVLDCGGREVSRAEVRITPGGTMIEVPVGGLLRLEPVS